MSCDIIFADTPVKTYSEYSAVVPLIVVIFAF